MQGEVVAPSREHVLEDLNRIHLTVLKLDEDPNRVEALKRSLRGWRGVSLYSLALFTRQLATLLHAGVPLARSLACLVAQPFEPRLGVALEGAVKDLKEGYSFSRALARQGNVFPSIYISMVRAGEISGAMDEILERLALYLEREYFLRKKVQAATSYPAVVFVSCIFVTLFIVNYVFPTFVELFQGLNIRLSAATRAMIALTTVVRDPSVMGPCFIGLALALLLGRAYTLTPLGLRQWHQLLLVSPVFGRLFHKAAVARMCNILGTMLDSGIPLLQALAATALSVDNAIFADRIHDILHGLKGGVQLSVPMAEQRGFPPMLHHMVRAGEESGSLPLMLKKTAQLLEEDIDAYCQTLLALLEPLMVFGMGFLVIFILLAVFMPVYSLMEQF